MRTLRIASAVVVSTALIGALSACGGSAKPGDAAAGASAPASAGAASGAAPGGASAAADGATAGAPAPAGGKEQAPKEALTAAAAVMAKAGTAKLVLTGDKPEDLTSGVLSWKSPQALQISTTEDGEEVKMLFVGDVMYLGLSSEMAQLFAGKKWMKVDPGAAPGSAPGAADAGAFSGMLVTLDPAVELAANAQAGKVSKVGAEKIDGVDTVHYRSTVAAKDLVAAMSGASEASRASLLKELTGEPTFDFWINGKNELVQLGGSQLNPGKGAASATGTVKYTELGTAVAPAAPAAAEVADMAELLKSLGTS